MPQEATTKIYERAEKLPEFGSLNVIQKLAGRGKDILDVGCASGYLGKILMARGNTVYGIDGNQEAVLAAQAFYQEAICLDLNNTTQENLFGGKKFDVIIFADVLEHLLDPEEVLLYFKQSLKPEGKIIVSLPNVALWRVRLNLFFGRFDYTDYGVLDRTHLHLYTFRSGRGLLKQTGFSVVTERAAMNLWLFGFLVSLLPFLKGLLGIHVILAAHKKD